MIFLSHNSKDKDAVRTLYKALTARGIDSWFDEKDLAPGSLWQPELEKGIRDATAIAVCLGTSGKGPWQDEEMQAALSLGVREEKPVIPIILPNVVGRPDVPLFLQSRTWVDLRPDFDEAALDRLATAVPKAEPSSDAKAHLLMAEMDWVRAKISELQGRPMKGTLESFGLPMREAAAESASTLSHIVDPGILKIIVENVAKAKDRFMKALGDPANSQQAKDQETDIVKSTICAELARLKSLNQGNLPEALVRDWSSFECKP